MNVYAPVTGLTNWAGNHAYVARALHDPESIEQVQEIVRNTRSLRVLGTRHSFNDIADTAGDLLSLRWIPRVFDLDRAAGTITVDGGVRYGELCGPLYAAGFALHSLASLPHISVAGACATATHGSGDRIGNLATAVTALEVVTGQEREWITGVIGQPFQLDDDGKIITQPSEPPSETPSVSDILDAFEEGKWANPPALDTPTESFPDWSDAVPTGIIPDDADTSI